MQVEEEGELDEVGRAICEGSGGVECLCSNHEKAHWDGFLFLWRRVLVVKVMKHPGEALVEVLHVGSVGFSGVPTVSKKVGLGDSAPCRCN